MSPQRSGFPMCWQCKRKISVQKGENCLCLEEVCNKILGIGDNILSPEDRRRNQSREKGRFSFLAQENDINIVLTIEGRMGKGRNIKEEIRGEIERDDNKMASVGAQHSMAHALEISVAGKERGLIYHLKCFPV